MFYDWGGAARQGGTRHNPDLGLLMYSRDLPFCTVLYSTVLYCTVLYCTLVLYTIVLYCTVL